jgi:hypothetical protein
LWARHVDAALFLGLKPWELRQLNDVTVDDLEAGLRADQQRHNRIVRLVVWALAKIPNAVALGFGGGDPTAQRKFQMKELLKHAPDYDDEADE